MCHKATLQSLARWFVLAFAGVMVVYAQTDWRVIGSSAMDSRLAGPVTGRIASVWYAPDGSKLYASTGSRVFETEDFENWKPAAVDAPDAPKPQDREPLRKPEPGATYLALNGNSRDIWGLGRQLYRSEDGTTWQVLTSYKSGSVIGGGIHGVAVSPGDPNQVAVANDYGVWRTLDGGLTWSSLNLRLPNLSIARIMTTPSGGHAARILTGSDTDTMLELTPGATLWQPYLGTAARRPDFSALHADISAFASSNDNRKIYAGSKDGKIWAILDSGSTVFQTQTPPSAGQHEVQRFYVDPANRDVALAALGGKGIHILRTWDGANWESVGADGLPDTQVNSITADPASRAVYVATDNGVFWTHFDFESGALANDIRWTSVSDGLPQARAVDVALDSAGVQLYAALEGYGLFGTPAPHRADVLRLVNTADYSTRAASPGSLVSILGEKISSVTGGSLRYPLWGDSQIQVPFEAVGPMVSLAMQTPSGIKTRDLQVLPVSPAIFVGSDGVPMILDADSGMQLDGNVAHPGQRLQILVTGLGKVRPDWPTGQPAPATNPPAVVARVQAYLDRSEIPVERATLAPGWVGYYLVEVQLPVVANYGGMELYVAGDGQDSNHVQILIAR